ncbi:MAG TPA: PH domain-containing protein [Ruminiclostridium sp.]
MEFKHIRGNCLILFEKVIEIPAIIIGVIFGVFLVKSLDEQALIPIAFILLSPISRLINYFFTYYTLSEDYLIVESGVFTKKKTEIPFSTITTVDLSQNIIFQLFRVYKIKVDNASQTNEVANKSNVNLTLKIDEAIRFKQIITNRLKIETSNIETAKIETAKKEEIEAMRAQPQDFVKLGLLQSKSVYFLSIIAVVGPLLGTIAPSFQNVFVGGLIVAAIIIIYLITIAVSVVKCVVTYYNFKVWADDDALKVQYGFLNKKSFSLQKSKINGIILKQSLLMKLCKLYTAEVIVIGYGDSSKEGGTEQAILFPIASIERIMQIVNRVLPEYKLDYTLCKPQRKAIRYFFFSLGFGFVAVACLSAIIVAIHLNNYIVLICAILVLALSIVGVMLKFGNAGICVGDKNVVLSAGGFNKMIAIVKTKSIESITSSGSIFKRKRGFVSIKLGFIAPLRVSNIASLNLPVTQFDLLKGVLKY